MTTPLLQPPVWPNPDRSDEMILKTSVDESRYFVDQIEQTENWIKTTEKLDLPTEN